MKHAVSAQILLSPPQDRSEPIRRYLKIFYAACSHHSKGSRSTIQSAVKALEQWSAYKNLQLNSDKCKELIIDFKRTDTSSTL